MKILVIVVTYNGMQWIDRCLSSVLASGCKADIYVVDNASPDGTADYVEAHFPQAMLIRNSGNAGFAEGNNMGFRHAMENGYDYVYLLNQDAWIAPDTLEGLVKVHQAHPDFWILGPDQMKADGKTFDPGFARKIVPTERPVDLEMGLYEVPFVMASHWFIPVDVLRRIGVFAEMFPIYGNDDNFCHRVLYHKGRIGVVDSLKVVHDRIYAPQPIDKKVYKNFYISSLVALADIRRPMFLSALYVLALALVKTVKYGSFKPLGKLRSIFGKDMKDIRSLRNSSK